MKNLVLIFNSYPMLKILSTFRRFKKNMLFWYLQKVDRFKLKTYAKNSSTLFFKVRPDRYFYSPRGHTDGCTFLADMLASKICFSIVLFLDIRWISVHFIYFYTWRSRALRFLERVEKKNYDKMLHWFLLTYVRNLILSISMCIWYLANGKCDIRLFVLKLDTFKFF